MRASVVVLAGSIALIAAPLAARPAYLAGDLPARSELGRPPSAPTPVPAALLGSILITFEERSIFEPMGTIQGITFGSAWAACRDSDAGGSCLSANEPSPENTGFMPFLSTAESTRISFPEPVFEVSFDYTWDTDVSTPTISFFDANDRLLGSRALGHCGATFCGASCTGDPSGSWCAWNTIDFSSPTSIAYLQFDVAEDLTAGGFDNLQVVGASSILEIPTAGTYSLMALGLLLAAAGFLVLRQTG